MISEINQRITQLNNGEVPSGYKKTSVGIVPNEWTEHTLGDIFIFKNGLNKEKGAFGQGTPIVNYTDVWKKRGLRAKDINGRVALSEKEIQTYEAKAGDVFFTRTSETIDEIGYSSVLLEDVENAVFSGFVLRARPYNDLVHREYHQYCYSEPLMRQEIIKRSSMTTRALTSGPMLSQVAINLPSHREQSKIAEILMKWDEAIELQEQYIINLKKKKLSIMRNLFSFSNECILPFKDVVKPHKYKKELQTSQYQETGSIPVVDQGKNKIVAYTDNKDYIISPPEKGLLLFGDHTTEVKYINYEFAVGGDGVKLFEEKVPYLLKYVYYYLITFPFLIEGYKRHYSILRNKPIKFPIREGKIDRKKMDEVVLILSRFDEMIDLHTTKMRELKKQRKALQQYLLNGIVRV